MILGGLCLLLGLTGGPKAAGTEPGHDRLAKILADWDRRRERLHVVRYHVSGEQTIPKGSTLDPQTNERMQPPQPDRDRKARKNFVLLLDFARNRHRLDCDMEELNRYAAPGGAIERVVQGSLYDGTALQSLNEWDKSTRRPDPRKPSADLAIMRGYVGNYSGFNHYTYPLFLGHGCFARGMAEGDGYLCDHLKSKPDPKRFSVRADVVLAGRPCTVLRVEGQSGYTDLWVDRDKDSAVVRILNMTGASEVADALRIDYQDSAKGWLPRHWTWEHYRHYLDGGLDQSEEMRVDRVDVEPPLAESAFRYPEKPGMLIAESVQQAPAAPSGPARVSDVKWFRVGAHGERSEIPYPAEQAPTRPQSWWRWWRTAISVPPLVLAWLIFRWRKKGPCPGNTGGQGA